MGALRGLGSNPAVEDLPLGCLGRGQRRNLDLHSLQGRRRCACRSAPASCMRPRESSPASELSQDRIRALRVSRPSARRLSISTLQNGSLHAVLCVSMRLLSSPSARGTIGAVLTLLGGAGRESNKSHVVFRNVRVCFCLMLGSCFLYIW
jgi:hypothetical protein